MPEDGGQGQEAGGQAQGAEGSNQDGSAGAQGAGGGTGSQGGQGGEEAFDKDRAMATIKAQRESEAAAKKELADTKAELKKLQDAALTEDQRREARTKELEEQVGSLTEANKRLMQDGQLLAAAIKAKSSTPDAVVKLVDRSALEVGEDGSIKDAAKAVKAVQDAYPQLFGQAVPNGDGGARGGSPAGDDMNARIRRGAGR